MQNVIKKAIEDARAMISRVPYKNINIPKSLLSPLKKSFIKIHSTLQKLIDENKLVTQKTVQDAMDILRGSVMIVYPMGLPPYDVIRLELENNEDLSGTHASLEVTNHPFSIKAFNLNTPIPLHFTTPSNKPPLIVNVKKKKIEITGN